MIAISFTLGLRQLPATTMVWHLCTVIIRDAQLPAGLCADKYGGVTTDVTGYTKKSSLKDWRRERLACATDEDRRTLRAPIRRRAAQSRQRSNPLPCPRTASNDACAEGRSDTSSIMRTVEALLTTAVKRFVGPVCDFAETRAPRPVREGNQRLRHFKCLEAPYYWTAIAKRAGDATTVQAAQDC
jgi:hypothetical protein